MTGCWAATLGDCAGPLSGEHVVSETLYGVSTVTVIGMPWCREVPKTVGVANLKAKILCTSHNSRLSPVDSGGKHTFQTLGRCLDLGRQRASAPADSWSLDRFVVDGLLLERWLLKTAINLLVARRLLVADGAIGPLEPVPERLVRVAFGLDSLSSPTGAYVASHPGEPIGSQNNMTIGLLADPVIGLLGVLYSIEGFRFLLWFALQAPPQRLELPGIMQTGWETSDLRRHLRYLGWKVNGKPSHYIDFEWPDQPATGLNFS